MHSRLIRGEEDYGSYLYSVQEKKDALNGISIFASQNKDRLLQIFVGLILTLVVIGFSGWRKNHVQACVFGFLFFCTPILLTALGFEFAQQFSLYPLYVFTL